MRICLPITLFFLLLCASTGMAQRYLQDGVLNVLTFDEPPSQYMGDEIYRNTPDSLYHDPEFGRLPFNAQCGDCYELLQERTINTRLFYKNGTDGSTLYKQQSYGPLHYKDENKQWRTIDDRLKQVKDAPGRFEAMDQPIPVIVDLTGDFTQLNLKDGSSLQFNAHTTCFVLDQSGNKTMHFGSVHHPVYTAGNNGVIQYNAWPGIDRQYFVHRGEVKTGYVLQDRLNDLPDHGWLVFEETVRVDEGNTIQKKEGGIPLPNGRWYGDYIVKDEFGRLATIGQPTMYDSNPNPLPVEGWPICYELQEVQGTWKLRLLVDLEYLQSTERVYPVVIDPIVLGSNTYNAGYMGFPFDPVCFDVTNYCNYQMTVIVPGKSTVTSAWFDIKYYSKNGGCGIGTQCRKKDAAFYMEGPCGTSPRPNGYWTCDSTIISTIPGLCYGDSIAAYFRHLVLCDSVPPSCPDHVLDFEMRTMQCSCPPTTCDTACHIIRPGTWRITVEARTLEGFVLNNRTLCPGTSVDMQAFGSWGVPPYTYAWQPSGKTTKSITETPLATTTYYCTITDQCGITVVDTARITVREAPDVSLSKVDALCSGGSDGTATAMASGTQGPYQYKWNTDPVQTTGIASSLTPGWYRVTATDAFGCTITDSIQVGYVNLMEAGPTFTDVSCFGFDDGSITLQPQGTGPFTYQWDDSSGVQMRDSLAPGTYRVTVTDATGCVDTASVTISEPPALDVDAGQDQNIVEGQVANLQGTVMPPGTYAYEWRPPGTLSSPTALATNASPDSTTSYILHVSSAGNPDCWQEDSMTVFVLPQTKLYVPSAFSPNGDGQNDVFQPKGDAQILSIQIYNRWGNLLYEGVTGWNGNFEGQPQPVGTYIYVIKISEPLSEESTQLQGNVTLLR